MHPGARACGFRFRFSHVRTDARTHKHTNTRTDTTRRNNRYRLSLGIARLSCLGEGGERPNERVITVGIGWVLLVSAISEFSGYISLPTAPLRRGASSSVGKSI